MVEPRGNLDLAQEPLGTQRLRQLGAQHFERDTAVVLHVGREVHRGHAAGTEFARDRVSTGQ